MLAMLAALEMAKRSKELGISTLNIKLRATEGNGTKTAGPEAQSALKSPRPLRYENHVI